MGEEKVKGDGPFRRLGEMLAEIERSTSMSYFESVH
jgi:hypothetical protein